MFPSDTSTFLRRALLADAVVSGATGALLLLLAGVLDGWLGLPTSLLRYGGLFLLPFAAFVAWVGTRENPSHAPVGTVIACNLLWAGASVLLLFVTSPTTLGTAFVLAQAAVVALFGELQWSGLRRPLATA